MKRAVEYSYTFTPSNNLLDLSDIPNFSIKRLFAILDIDARSVIYAVGQEGYGFTSLADGVLTLQASMSGATPQDRLFIVYDDGDQPGAAEFIQLVQNSEAVSPTNRLPVEIDTQNAGLSLDATVAAAVTALGTVGSGPPTLPGLSTGVIGFLRLIASLISAGTVGAAAEGAAASGDPVRIAGSDGSGNIRTLRADALGVLISGKGLSTHYNLTSATTIKASPGRVAKLSVLVAGSAAGSINDCADVASTSTANEIAITQTTVGVYDIDWPCAAGISITPGTGQTLALSYE